MGCRVALSSESTNPVAQVSILGSTSDLLLSLFRHADYRAEPAGIFSLVFIFVHTSSVDRRSDANDTYPRAGIQRELLLRISCASSLSGFRPCPLSSPELHLS